MWGGSLAGPSEIEGAKGFADWTGQRTSERVSSGLPERAGRVGGCGDLWRPGRTPRPLGGPPRSLRPAPRLPSRVRGQRAGCGRAGGRRGRAAAAGRGGGLLSTRQEETDPPTAAGPARPTSGSRHVGSPARLGRLRACRRPGSRGAQRLRAGPCAACDHRGSDLDPGPAEQLGTAARGEE